MCERADCQRCPVCGDASGDISFDRSLCACGAMHDYCNKCGFAFACKFVAAAPAPSTGSGMEPGAVATKGSGGKYGLGASQPRVACVCFPANDVCPSSARCDPTILDEPPVLWEDVKAEGHEGYLRLLNELRTLHAVKSGGYGTGEDKFANFSAVADLSGEPRYLYPVLRSIEKLTRLLSLHAQGRTGELGEELMDVSSLMLCAEAMRREDR